MPYTVYGLLKGIRNHRIDSPHVTGRSGGSERPNACNLCHVDRTLGVDRRRADALVSPAGAGRARRRRHAGGDQWLLSGDAVLRAIAAWQLRLARRATGGAGGRRGAVPRRSARRSLLGGALRRGPRARQDRSGVPIRLPGARSPSGSAPPTRSCSAGARSIPRAPRTRRRSPPASNDLLDKRDDSPVRAME